MNPSLHVASGRLYGGIERMLTTLATCGGNEFEFAVAADGRLLSELRERQARVQFLGDVRLRHPASVLRARHRFRSILRSRPFSAVVCHAPWSHAIFAGVARGSGIPTILWQHDRASGGGLIERACRAAGADLVICNSHWTATTACLLQPSVTHQVIYCPATVPAASADDRVQVRAELGASADDVVILTASRMEPWKGHLDLLRALDRLRSKTWKLWIAGGAQRSRERTHEAAVQAEIRRLGLDLRVKLLGERRDMARLLAGADLLAQANVEPEPFGIIFAEALLAGVPVVTTNVGGAPEVVGPSCGRLVAPNDVAALAEALEELVSDLVLRACLAASGPAHAAARCAPAVVLPQLSCVLSSVSIRSAA
jgi:glycosyltransferase involved in cell wall biosynthesis